MATALLVALLPLVDGDTPDPVPADNDVTAGWTAFLVFLFLALAVVVLARSFVKQMRKTQAAREAGVYGDQPAASDGPGLTPEDPAEATRQRRDAGPR